MIVHAAGVIAQEINGFAQFSHAVQPDFSRLARQKCEEEAEVFFVQIRSLVQHFSAFRRWDVPCFCSDQCGLYILGARPCDLTDWRIGRGVLDRDNGPTICCARDQRCAVEICLRKRATRSLDLFQVRVIGQVQTHRVLACSEKLGPGGDVRGFDGQRVERAGSDLFGCDAFIDDLVYERTVRAVLQQATHQIGQQVAMRADGGIDAAAGVVCVHDDLVQTLPHAMQTLEFVGLRVDARVLRDV